MKYVSTTINNKRNMNNQNDYGQFYIIDDNDNEYIEHQIIDENKLESKSFTPLQKSPVIKACLMILYIYNFIYELLVV